MAEKDSEKDFLEEIKQGIHEVACLAPLNYYEVTSLWKTCLHYGMLQSVAAYFRKNCEDEITSSLLDEVLERCGPRVDTAVRLIGRDGLPAPRCFDEKDLNPNAPRLFTDQYYLFYLRNMVRIGLNINTSALTMASRPDVRRFYRSCCYSIFELWEKLSDVLLVKGIFIQPPQDLIAEEANRKQNVFEGFQGKQRPLLAEEIGDLYSGLIMSIIGRALLLGFQQVAQTEQVRDYLSRGAMITARHADTYSGFLRKKAIPLPAHGGEFITDSKVAPFSDRLMMFHAVTLNAASMENYAATLTSSMRHELSANYSRLIEVSNYAEDGIQIMMANGWLEEPPHPAKRP